MLCSARLPLGQEKKPPRGERLFWRRDVARRGSFLGELRALPLIGGKTIGDPLLLEFVESAGRWGSGGVYETAAGAKLWQGSGRRRRREAVVFGFWV